MHQLNEHNPGEDNDALRESLGTSPAQRTGILALAILGHHAEDLLEQVLVTPDGADLRVRAFGDILEEGAALLRILIGRDSQWGFYSVSTVRYTDHNFPP